MVPFCYATPNVTQFFAKRNVLYRIEPALSGMPWHRRYMEEGRYDLVALHTIWNQPEMERLLGPKVISFCLHHPNKLALAFQAVFFTLVRDPSDAFESMFNYFNLTKGFGMNMKDYINK